MELRNLAIGCIAAGIGVLIVALAYLRSCHAEEVAWLQRKLRELAEENAKLREEVKHEIPLS